MLATRNPRKVAWMRAGLAHVGVAVRAAKDAEAVPVEEDGATCEANAWLKARAVVPDRAAIVVAEDSGLFVDALGGRPGTHTARWAHGTDDDRARLLLASLRGVPRAERGARFVSAVAIRFPDGSEATRTGVLVGRIATRPGPTGSGYGGVFRIGDGRLLSRTVGLGSHRRDALAATVAAIRERQG